MYTQHTYLYNPIYIYIFTFRSPRMQGGKDKEGITGTIRSAKLNCISTGAYFFPSRMSSLLFEGGPRHHD